MYFNSVVFILLFLPVVFAGYFCLNKFHLLQAGRLFLTAASLTFYAYYKIEYLFIISISIIVNYLIGRQLATRRIKYRKTFLSFGIFLNLAALGYYKYTNFAIENLNTFAGTNIPYPGILLPLAISFFTFQQIAYLVDSYRRETKEYHFINYVLFVTFFPQLIAGPIVHHKEMMPQFSYKRAKMINWNNVALGLQIFILGLAKKVFIADFLAKWADTGFENASTLSCLDAWITSLSYTFQLYFDFSGYCDMAVGIALLFNIKLPINFNSPYKAVNIQDFWRRWHITLSRWLRDYLYIPLGGNKKGKPRTYINVFLVFFLGGVWHGAGWTFIIWGILHGVANAIYRFYKEYVYPVIPLNKYMAWLITFLFVNTAWVFFRATSVEQALQILVSMYGGLKNPFVIHHTPVDISTYFSIGNLFVLFALIAFCVIYPNTLSQTMKPTKMRAVFLGVLLTICVWMISKPDQSSPFLYFNF